jgi:DNA-binding response OmpR family regulator
MNGLGILNVGHAFQANRSKSSEIRLTRKEKALLAMLKQNAGHCISRETLLRSVWQYSESAKTRTVDVHVQRLRRKLGEEAIALKTIVRLGYCWFPDPQALAGPKLS